MKIVRLEFSGFMKTAIRIGLSKDILTYYQVFLNSRARWYYENCDKNKSILYPSQVKRISLLFAMVPEEMKGLLEWNGPCC